MEILSLILIFGYILIMLVILLIAHSKYVVFEELKSNEDSNFGTNNGGQWIAGTYYFRPPLPIEDDSKDEQIKTAISKHNKIITIFWIWALMIIPIIILLNLIEK